MIYPGRSFVYVYVYLRVCAVRRERQCESPDTAPVPNIWYAYVESAPPPCGLVPLDGSVRKSLVPRGVRAVAAIVLSRRVESDVPCELRPDRTAESIRSAGTEPELSIESARGQSLLTVSYTHLTLPTILLV